MKRFVTLIALLILCAAIAESQERSLTPRDLQEMFYTDTLTPAKGVAAKKTTTPAATTGQRKTAAPAPEPDQSARRVGIKFRIQQ